MLVQMTSKDQDLTDQQPVYRLIREAIEAAFAEHGLGKHARRGAAGDYLTVPEVSRRYGVGRRTVRRACEEGNVQAGKRAMPGGRDGWVIPIVEAERVWGTSAGESPP
jgi:hypothetical protein